MSARFQVQAPAYAEPDADSELPPPAGIEGTPPPGLALTEALIRGLSRRDMPPRNRWVTPHGHAFDVEVGGQRFDVTVALEGPAEDGVWTIEAEARRGLLPRRTDPDSPALAHLRDAVRDALGDDPRVEDVR
ncbi:MAG: hypothetical protein H6746_01705 [Deltaproteobacteria bacterium]|nr:hypothetical protein [Deltaproteobacteria bacterium]